MVSRALAEIIAERRKGDGIIEGKGQAGKGGEGRGSG